MRSSPLPNNPSAPSHRHHKNHRHHRNHRRHLRHHHWLTAAATLLAAVPLAVALPVSDAGPAVAASHATTLPTCPSTTYGYSEIREQYGTAVNTEPLDVDEYTPAASGGHTPPSNVPGVIMVHGGQWTEGNFHGGEGTADTTDDGMSSLAECFADNGFDAFTIDYALTDTYAGKSELSFPQNLQDIHNVIGYLKSNVTNLNQNELLILGQSAGANLAELAGENAMQQDDGLQGVLSQSGPADLTALGAGCSSSSCQAGSVGAIVHTYLGCYETSTSCTLQYTGMTKTVPGSAAYSDASSMDSLSATVPAPPYLVMGSSDEIIPVTEDTGMAQQLYSHCQSTGGSNSDQLVILPGDQHAATYTDIVAGPELDFANAVVNGTLASGCGVASPLTGASMAYDANSSVKKLFRFGGCCTSSGTADGSTYVYEPSTSSWDKVNVTGAAPSPRIGAAFGYDPTSKAEDLVLFGGESVPSGSAQPAALDDTWVFTYTASSNTGTWTQVDTTASCPTQCPGARYAAAADEAPHTQGLALFGGESVIPASQEGPPVADGDTWVWNGTSQAWTEVSSSSSVLARYGAVMAYDGPNNIDVLFGGNQNPDTSYCTASGKNNPSASCLNLLNDTWELSYDTTSQTWSWATGGTAPAGLLPREFATGSSAADGMTVFGGLNGTGTGGSVNSEQLMGDTWTWTETGGWTQPCDPCSPSPPATTAASMAYQRADSDGFLFGGYTDTAAPAAPDTTWSWNGTAWQG